MNEYLGFGADLRLEQVSGGSLGLARGGLALLVVAVQPCHEGQMISLIEWGVRV